MPLRTFYFTALLFVLLAPAMARVSWGGTTSLRGYADISYVDYDAEVDGKKIFSGDTLAQQYSLSYYASNLYYRSQPRYYDLKLGYDLVSFDTNISTPGQDLELSETLGKFKYSGEVGYNVTELPIRFRAFINDDQPYRFVHSYNDVGLINNGLIYSLEGYGTSRHSGVSLAFEPQRARNPQLYGLPRMLLDYRETVNKASYGFYHVDNKTKQLAVAGLNKENNWIHYRTLDYENYLDARDNYKEQHIQIGMVDNIGRRKWSALTNWIEFSADGRLTNVTSPSRDKEYEEYDANFMAIASRRTWNARTFMNYNRLLDDTSRTEEATIPIYIKGLYGRDADWHLGLSANRGREQRLGSKEVETSYRNSISAGATTYKQANFTLSPEISLATYRSYGQNYDAYTFQSSVSAISTRRFSKKVDLAGKILVRATDDGANLESSTSWSSLAEISAIYRMNDRFTYSLTERLETGSGASYLESRRQHYGVTKNYNDVGTYVRNYIKGEVTWAKSSRFTTSLSGSYDVIKASDFPVNDEMVLTYSFTFDDRASSYHLNSIYARSDNGLDPVEDYWQTFGEFLYRPDRYNDGRLLLSHKRDNRRNTDTDELDILQTYNYNFFSRAGVIRNLATLTEEYSYERSSINGRSGSTQYLMLAGRYNPTSRLSLYGSVKYEKYSNDAVAIYYSGGVNADFSLLSTSVDYSYARRDKDDRVEKKLAASVRRSF